MRFTTLLFDLDDTLYPASSGLWEAIRKRMECYLRDRIGIPSEKIPELRAHLYRTYGTTLRGLQATRDVDTLDYLAYVHDVPLEQYISPDPAVREMLLGLPQRKVIFTNADSTHARRVLAVLRLEDCFDQIVDILDITPYCKPQMEAFQVALAKIGEQDPRRCLFIDDAPRNLTAARAIGLFTVLVGSAGPCGDADDCIPRLVDLPGVLERANGRSASPIDEGTK
jgi:pyrimidine 5'-nucleotidase